MSSWVDGSGREIDPRHMSDRHLSNSIAYVQRLIDADHRYVPPAGYYGLLAEYNKRVEEDKE
tara:strand:+ start:365 stop:550 length:186 start_codon:yes stop_codon:yes gene_type:complete